MRSRGNAAVPPAEESRRDCADRPTSIAAGALKAPNADQIDPRGFMGQFEHYKMTRRRALGVASASALVAAVWDGSTAQAANFGELVVLEGKAVITRAGKHYIVRDHAPVEEGDRVDTLADTRAQLIIGPKDQGLDAVLSSRTSITVNQVKQSPSALSPISLGFGALRARIRAWSGQPFVATRAATIGIKGTDFVTWVKRPEAAEFVGIEGLIECVSQTNKDYSIRIGQRQWGEIVENEQPKAPIRVPDSIWDAVQKEFAFPSK